MKKLVTNSLLAIAVLIGSMTINSCSNVEDIIDNITIPVPFAINVNKNNLDIPFVVGTEFVKSPSIPLNIDLDAEIKERFSNMSVNNVKSAKLSSFSISRVSSSADVTFADISDARLYISAPDQSDRLVATVTNNTSPDALNFTPITTEPDSELVNYLKSPQASIYMEIKGSANKVSQMKINISSSFKIQVSL